MNLTSIHHIAIIVSDYNLSKDFYVDKLGFSIIRENYRPERNDWKLDLQCGNIELEIFGVSNPPTRVSNPEACGLRHLAFRVDDVEATVKELEKLDIECEPIGNVNEETIKQYIQEQYERDRLEGDSEK